MPPQPLTHISGAGMTETLHHYAAEFAARGESGMGLSAADCAQLGVVLDQLGDAYATELDNRSRLDVLAEIGVAEPIALVLIERAAAELGRESAISNLQVEATSWNDQVQVTVTGTVETFG